MSNAKSINKVILVGRLGQNPKLHHFRQKRPLCTFDVATEGIKASDTAWHPVVVYGKLAQKCSAELRKGALVYIEGILQGRVWEDGSKIKHKTYSIYPKIVRVLSAANEPSTCNERYYNSPVSTFEKNSSYDDSSKRSEVDD